MVCLFNAVEAAGAVQTLEAERRLVDAGEAGAAERDGEARRGGRANDDRAGEPGIALNAAWMLAWVYAVPLLPPMVAEFWPLNCIWKPGVKMRRAGTGIRQIGIAALRGTGLRRDAGITRSADVGGEGGARSCGHDPRAVVGGVGQAGDGHRLADGEAIGGREDAQRAGCIGCSGDRCRRRKRNGVSEGLGTRNGRDRLRAVVGGHAGAGDNDRVANRQVGGRR